MAKRITFADNLESICKTQTPSCPIDGQTIDRVWTATPQKFFMDFQVGGSLEITVKKGKLTYKLKEGAG